MSTVSDNPADPTTSTTQKTTNSADEERTHIERYRSPNTLLLGAPTIGDVLRTANGFGLALALFTAALAPLALVAAPFTSGGFIDPAGMFLGAAGWLIGFGLLTCAGANGANFVLRNFRIRHVEDSSSEDT